MEIRQRSQQPGAGAAAVPGVMERGQRRGPLSECVPGQHGGRAAGATERKRPARCCAAVVRGLGCRGCQHGRGGTLPACFRSQSRSVRPSSALLPLSPRGAATAGAPCRWGSRWRFAAACGERRAGFAAKPHFKKGRSPCLEGAAERRRGMVRRRALRRPPGRRKARG